MLMPFVDKKVKKGEQIEYSYDNVCEWTEWTAVMSGRLEWTAVMSGAPVSGMRGISFV